MAKPRVRLKIGNIRKLLKSIPVQSEVARKAHLMAQDAGQGFEYVVKPHRYTARAFVQTDLTDDTGRRRQAEEHVLQRVVGRRR